MKHFLCILFIAALFSSLKEPQDNKKIFQQLSVLHETWKMETSKGVLYEGWQKLNDTLLQGGSYKIKGRDTLFLERVSLKHIANRIFYVPVVEENNMQSVSFKLTSTNYIATMMLLLCHSLVRSKLYSASINLHQLFNQLTNKPN